MIVVLTALEVEYQAVRDHLAGVRTRRHQAGTRFEVGSIATSPNTSIALAATGIGNLSAATLTERAVVEFNPSAMLFVGVAGGLQDWLRIGDVVVATKVYAYHGGRSEDRKFRVRPRSWEIAHEIEQAARHLSRSRAWRGSTADGGSPEVHFAPIAAGDVVQDSKKSPHALHLRDNYNDAVAVEMESAGFAQAGHLNRRVPTAAVRGISDKADGSKDTTDKAGKQPLAARNAAAFAVALAAMLDEDAVTEKEPEIPALSPIRNTNVARGNARVGQQNGINFGAYPAHPRGEDA